MKRLQFAANVVVMDLLLVLTIDGFIANWSLNPFYDFIYLQVSGPFFATVHVSSVLAICLVAWWKVLSDFKGLNPARWILIILASGSIHEFSIFYWNFLKGSSGCSCDKAIVWYAVILVSALIIAMPFQRRAFLGIAVVTALWMGFYVIFFTDSVTAIGVMQFYDSIVEIGSWMFIALAWLLVKRNGKKSS